jgi:hypothetical protein
MSEINQSMQLPIDEGEEWIWDTLDSTKDFGFEYIKDGNKEFLIFNTNDFFAGAKGLEKIKKTTGMLGWLCARNTRGENDHLLIVQQQK